MELETSQTVDTLTMRSSSMFSRRIPSSFLAALALLLAMSSALTARLVRLSEWLTVDELAEAGFGKLSADQAAAIDALAGSKVLAKKGEATADFSSVLSESEYAACGLNLLEAEELERLDDLVTAWRATAPAAKSLPSPFAAPSAQDIPFENGELRPKAGGSVSLTYGVAEGGGTLRSGSAMVTYDDPARGFSAAIGYSRTKADGGFVQPPIILAPVAAPGR